VIAETQDYLDLLDLKEKLDLLDSLDWMERSVPLACLVLLEFLVNKIFI